MKHVFCDLDGTLLQDFHRIDEQDILALKNAYHKGIKISIATGRLDYEIQMIMAKYDFKGYRISQNGGVIVNDLNETLYEKKLTTDGVKMILSALKGFETYIFIQTVNEYIVPKRVKLIEEFEQKQPFLFYTEKSDIFDTLDKYEIITISLWAEENQNLKIKKYLDTVLPNSITSTVSSKFTLDITCANNSKGNAISQICERDHIALNDIVVIGDSYNDISMFELTEHSFVMSHADDYVLSKAKFIVNSVKEVMDIVLNYTGVL
jgi:Cof subfamily protein (haloacid dehalogenase superfamily)